MESRRRNTEPIIQITTLDLRFHHGPNLAFSRMRYSGKQVRHNPFGGIIDFCQSQTRLYTETNRVYYLPVHQTSMPWACS